MLQIFDENFPLSANRRKGDYGSRTAVTQVSITTEDNLTSTEKLSNNIWDL